MQILAQEILKLSVTGGEDNRFLHPLFLILLFKHFSQATACNRTLDWLDLQLVHIEVVTVLSQITFTTVSENMVSHHMVSCHRQVTNKIKFCSLYSYPKQEMQFSEDGIRKLIVATNYMLVRETKKTLSFAWKKSFALSSIQMETYVWVEPQQLGNIPAKAYPKTLQTGALGVLYINNP